MRVLDATNTRALTPGEFKMLEAGTLKAPVALVAGLGFRVVPKVRPVEPAPEWAKPNQPGMDWSEGRCMTCDSRYCGATCHMVPGSVYVPGSGWVVPKEV